MLWFFLTVFRQEQKRRFLALTPGSSSAIANLIAGYSMTCAFRIGYRVKIAGDVGDVTEQKLQLTRLRSPKNEEIVIPNSQILNGDAVKIENPSHIRTSCPPSGRP